MSNLQLPGNPRYQPKGLLPDFGYDHMARPLVEVELAAMRSLADIGQISAEDIALLIPDVEQNLLAITMSQVDEVERAVTKHDIRALVQIMQKAMPEPLQKYVHVALTSYDVIDTARALQFKRAHEGVIRPKVREVVDCFRHLVIKHAATLQIGRTHGQHALPITVGFWLATVLSRVLYNAERMNRLAHQLEGKISGAVGAYNAQVALRFPYGFEQSVLKRLGLAPARISTQIVPPEGMAYYLHSCVMLSAAFAQFGCDCRQLARTEIGEVSEPFEKGQVGSSTMAHKRNPMTFENTDGTYKKNKNEYGNVFDALVSEHQRDLTGSSLLREFPTIMVNLVLQLDNLLRPGKSDSRPFLSRIVIDEEACSRNFGMMGDVILAEPMYLTLQMHGYAGDAHKLITDKAIPLVNEGKTLWGAVLDLRKDDPSLAETIKRLPSEVMDRLSDPRRYVGRARDKALEIAGLATDYLDHSH